MLEKFYEYEKSLSSKVKKELGIVYTPIEIVDFINEKVLSTWKEEHPPKVIDPCCGTGVFLYDMAHKISKRWDVSLDKVFTDYICGYDVDEKAIKICKDLLPNANIKKVEDSLKEDLNQFDLIVTNPPYIRIQNLEQKTRTYIQENFSLTKSNTDIYIAFLEKLAKTGKPVGLICPNSWIRNKSSRVLRKWFFDNKVVSELLDFGDEKVFDGIGVYTSIVIMNLEKKTSVCHKTYLKDSGKDIEYSNSDCDQIFLGLKKLKQNKKEVSIFDLCDINVGIATLADKIFYGEVLGEYEDGNLVSFKNKKHLFIIEKKVLKKCIKASKFEQVKKNTYIVYPYDEDKKLIEEKQFKKQFPLTYNMLSFYKKDLLKRDKGKIPKKIWYGYGRTQGLSKIEEDKLLLAPFQKEKLKVRKSNAGESFISGYALYPKKGYSFELIEKIITSEHCYSFVSLYAKSLSKGWIGLSKNNFKNYKLDLSLFLTQEG